MRPSLVPASDRRQRPRLEDLDARLARFYERVESYGAFTEPSDYTSVYELFLPYIPDTSPGAAAFRILEFGAGLTAFGRFIKARRRGIEFHAQDVTGRNRTHLQDAADVVHIGALASVPGTFDLVFSTYVVEHLADPIAAFQAIKRLLRPGGVHIVVCPNYELPGYVCPSLRHLDRVTQLRVTASLLRSRLEAYALKRPRFWVNTEPAALAVPWYRDADAVHLASQLEIDAWHRANGFDTRRLRVPVRSARAWLADKIQVRLAARLNDGKRA